MAEAEADTSPSPPLSLYYPTADDLPPRPPPAIQSNFDHFFAIDFMGDRHDQYIYRHRNGLCIIGLASTHTALDANSSIISVDFNIGKRNRMDMKVTGKRKKDAHLLEPVSILCKITSNNATFVVRCCIKGALLEVNERLIKEPSLLETKAASEGFIAIIMPRPGDWKNIVASLLTENEYTEKRKV